ncbi:MAG TPA: carboxypeptidase regulatory-like domain-containing protein [Acidobacteriaceae bacterium]|jgi:hypothetical protein|nr:carboxypeptidase regulatory-like domain-containing protein [Acidobacteriaceae bacterium]
MPTLENQETPVVGPLFEFAGDAVRSHTASGATPEPHGPWLRMGLLSRWSALPLLFLFWLFLVSPHALAQEFRGTISGVVTDSSGAVVPGAKVTAREASTGTQSRVKSDSAGQFVIPFLLPGTYTVTAELTGFETMVQTGIALEAQGHPIVNFALHAGKVSETVTVSAASGLLDVANASVGSVIPTRSVADLPINGRTPTTLAELAPGVITTAAPELIHPFDNNAGNEWSIGGTPNQVSEVLLDGAPDLTLLGALAYAPSEDSVSEVSIRPFDTDASFGHTIGGVINQVTKSGGNQLHGTAYEFGQVSTFDANTYFDDRNQLPVPGFHYNQYGVTAGGPIWIPKVYNGRDKLFWFFAWEGLRDETPATTTDTVPTTAEEGGDFSQTLSASSSNQLYNPFTPTVSGGNVTRSPIANNDLTTLGVPFNPIALNYLKLFPAPNATSGVGSDGANNYISNAPSTDTYNNELGRIDYNATARDHVFFDIRHNRRYQLKNNYFFNGATGTTLLRENYGATLDNVFTLNPTTFFNVRLNWLNFNEVHGTPAEAYNPVGLGFPASMNSSSEHLQLPYINFNTGGSCGSFTSYQCFGDTGSALDPTTSYQFFADMVKLIGHHSLKIGFDGRQYRISVQNFGDSSGSFTFNSNWVNSGTKGGVSNIFGGDLASFMLGLPSSGEYDLEARSNYHQYYTGSFVQDDWRVSDRLTLNMGLRFDIDTPFEERNGVTVNGFNRTATINYITQPAFGGATVSSNGESWTLPGINTLGGLTFPASHNGAVYATNNGFLSPRFGFAYGLNPSTVVRGGFGVFVQPETLTNLNAQGTYSSSAYSNSEGFSASTLYLATTNNYQTPATTLSNPFPSGFLPPAGSSQGASTFLGQSISFLAPSQHDPYSERWDLNVQHSLSKSSMLELIYVGNHAVHLPIEQQNLNAVPRQFLSTNPWENVDMKNAYGTSEPNPFENTLPSVNGVANSTSVNTSSKVSFSSLIVPFPQFGTNAVYIQNQTRGQSWFNSGIIHFEQRAAHGLTATANYGFSKLIEADTFLNDEDPAPTRRISPFDHVHHFTAGATYNLPFGQGTAFSFGGSRLWNEIVGGWVLNGIYQFQTGAPIEFSADIPLASGTSLRQISDHPRNTSPVGSGAPALSTFLFVTGNTTSCSTNPCDGSSFINGQYFDHVRTLPQTLSWVRADGYNNLDASLLKDFHFTESSFLQLRFETFNTLNHPVFSAPAVSSATSSSFGYITSTTSNSLPRQIQLGGRIVF